MAANWRHWDTYWPMRFLYTVYKELFSGADLNFIVLRLCIYINVFLAVKLLRI